VDDEVVGPEKEERVMRSNWLYLIVLPAAATFTAAQRFDVQFDAARSHWAGTWTRDGRAVDVMLERPRRPRGAGPNEFCGAWDEVDDDLPQLSGHPQPMNRLHVTESSDRQLAAWTDRPVVLGGRHYGERFRVIGAANRRLEIEWVHATDRA